MLWFLGEPMSTNFQVLLRSLTAYQQLVASGPSLASNARYAVDFTNTAGDILVTPFLELTFTTLPLADTILVDLSRLRGSSEGTQRFAEGGDGTTGADIDPQAVHYVGGFSLSDPSTTQSRIASLEAFWLDSTGNRFVLKNVSSNTITAGWTFGLKLERYRLDQV